MRASTRDKPRAWMRAHPFPVCRRDIHSPGLKPLGSCRPLIEQMMGQRSQCVGTVQMLQVADGDAAAEPAELIAAAAGGDLPAFERLYRQFSPRVYGLCLRLTGQREAAEDCTQDSFVAAWRALAGSSSAAASPPGCTGSPCTPCSRGAAACGWSTRWRSPPQGCPKWPIPRRRSTARYRARDRGAAGRSAPCAGAGGHLWFQPCGGSPDAGNCRGHLQGTAASSPGSSGRGARIGGNHERSTAKIPGRTARGSAARYPAAAESVAAASLVACRAARAARARWCLPRRRPGRRLSGERADLGGAAWARGIARARDRAGRTSPPTFDEPRNASYVAARDSLEVNFRERLTLLDPATRAKSRPISRSFAARTKTSARRSRAIPQARCSNSSGRAPGTMNSICTITSYRPLNPR